MDVSDLAMVDAICASGSLTRAAQALHVSQPTLSKRLARLEQQLDATLFHRASTGLRPTPVADFLLASAAPLRDRLGAIERQVERMVACDYGELRIGVGPIIEQVLLPGALAATLRRSGAVRVSVVTEHDDVLRRGLDDGSLDVIAGPFDAADPAYAAEGIAAIGLIREGTVNVARAGHPIFAAGSAGDVLDHPYAAPALQGAMRRLPDPPLPRQRLHADNYTLLKALALDSDYICGGPRAVFTAELASGALREVPGSFSVQWQSACLVRREALDTPLVRLFVDVLVGERDRYLAGRGGG